MPALIMMNQQCVQPAFCTLASPAVKYRHKAHFKLVEDLYSQSSVFSSLTTISFLLGRQMGKAHGSAVCLRSCAVKYQMENSGLLTAWCCLTYLPRLTHPPQFKPTKYFHGDLKDCHHITKVAGGVVEIPWNRKWEKFSKCSSAKTCQNFTSSAASQVRRNILLYFTKIWTAVELL